jgi:hypothetical protein
VLAAFAFWQKPPAKIRRMLCLIKDLEEIREDKNPQKIGKGEIEVAPLDLAASALAPNAANVSHISKE